MKVSDSFWLAYSKRRMNCWSCVILKFEIY